MLQLFWLAVVGWQLGRSALAADRLLTQSPENAAFLANKMITARFFAQHWMPAISGLLAEALGGSDCLLAMPDDAF